MLSRVADSLYWMSRYLERAENTVRQLDVTMSLMLDTGGDSSTERRWQQLIAALGNPPGLEWNGSLDDDGAGASSSITSITVRSRTASTSHAKTPARSAKKSPPSSGSASTASITRCTRPTFALSSAPA